MEHVLDSLGIGPPHADPPVKNSILEIREVPRHMGRRRSSVVERVIGNDEVDSSILSGGTRVSEFSHKPTDNPTSHTHAWMRNDRLRCASVRLGQDREVTKP